MELMARKGRTKKKKPKALATRILPPREENMGLDFSLAIDSPGGLG